MVYNFTIQKEIDIDAIAEKMMNDPDIVNILVRKLGSYETSFVQFLIQDGVQGIHNTYDPIPYPPEVEPIIPDEPPLVEPIYPDRAEEEEPQEAETIIPNSGSDVEEVFEEL